MIVLTVESFNGAPVDALVASFDELGGTIGRADNNQLVLPDPERTISRIHAQVVFRNGAYALVDRGSNAVLLNGQPLGNGIEKPIRDGDRLEIGGYRIAVSFGHKTITRDPFADLFGRDDTEPIPRTAPAVHARQTPQAESPLFGAAPAAGPPATPSPPAWPQEPRSRHAPVPGGGGIPDDWDPFAPDDPGNKLGIGASAPATSANPYIPDLPIAAPSQQESLDQLFGLDPGAGNADPLARSPAAAPQAPPNTAADADPLRAFGITPGPVAAAVPDHASELNTPWRQGQAAPTPAAAPPGQMPAGAVLSWGQPSRQSKAVRPPPAAPGTPIPERVREPMPAAPAMQAPSAAIARPAAAPDALLSAFLEGLGSSDLRLERFDAETMRLIGQLLREATRGTVELLIARAALKREMRADVTMIVARENNPLKFSPSTEVALQHLLGTPAPGFLSAPQAMRDAFDDLRAHQLGVMAGMRAALEGVLQRFDPAVLEGRIARRSGLSGLLAGGRKAQLWEQFQTLYAQLSEEAAEDFHELFGKAFLRAYESHIERLRGDE